MLALRKHPLPRLLAQRMEARRKPSAYWIEPNNQPHPNPYSGAGGATQKVLKWCLGSLLLPR